MRCNSKLILETKKVCGVMLFVGTVVYYRIVFLARRGPTSATPKPCNARVLAQNLQESAHNLSKASKTGRGTEQRKTGQMNPDHLSGRYHGHFRRHLRGKFCGCFRGKSLKGFKNREHQASWMLSCRLSWALSWANSWGHSRIKFHFRLLCASLKKVN